MHYERRIIDCLRHGACVGPSCLRGRSDMALNAEGEAQMERALKVLQPPQRLVSSPLQRCRKSAAQFADYWQLALELDDQLAEMDFGSWDGVALTTLHQRYPDQLAQFWQDPYTFLPPQAEPLTDFSERCHKAWLNLVEHPGPHTLVVTHGGVIKTWLAATLGITRLTSEFLASLGVEYASLTRFEVIRDDHGECWSKLVYLGPATGAPRCT